MVFSFSRGLGNSVCEYSRRISRIDNIGQHSDCQTGRNSVCGHHCRISARLILTLYLFYGVLVLKGSNNSDSNSEKKNCMCGTLERVNSRELIQGRLRTLMAIGNDPTTRTLLEDTIALIEHNRHQPRIVPEVRLSSTRVCRQHFVQWDLQVFMPRPIWQSVSFPPDRDITDTESYLFVAVLFFVDKNLQDREPRVWRELNVA